MNKLNLLGRILFAIPFGVFGVNHFLMYDLFVGMATTIVPGTGFSVMLTGVILIVGSVSIMLNKYVKITCYTIAAMLALFIMMIHIPNMIDGDENKFIMGFVNLLKDTSLIGGALMIVSKKSQQPK